MGQIVRRASDRNSSAAARNARHGWTVDAGVDVTALPIPLVRWRVAAIAAAISVASMPLTAIWFLLLAPVALVVGAVAAALARSPRRQEAVLGLSGGIGLGMLAGPIVYLTLALAT